MNASIRQKVLQEWRGIYTPREKADRTKSVSDLLRGALAEFGLADKLDENLVRNVWRELVGDFLADHSTPATLKQGTLIVHVLQPTLLYDLDRQWKPRVLAALQAKFGAAKIRQVRFRAG